MRIFIIILVVLLVVSVIGFLFARSYMSNSVPRPSAVNQSTNSLSPCPNSPNCVSTMAEKEGKFKHYVEPIPFEGDAAAAQAKLLAIINDMARTTVVVNEPGYLYTEYRSAMWQFVDDLELLISENDGVIHFRSAARVGYDDIGVNRKRYETIRTLFLEG